MLHPLPAIPAVRTFTPGHTNFSPPGTPVTEALVEVLGFVPRFTPSEAYEIELDAKGVKLRALDPAGLSHARATWNQLKGQKQLPSGLIQDEPRFEWRGLMLDCVRHFFPVANLKLLLDRMASLKLNRFHWHLVDDQAWRLQISSLPRLTALSGQDFYSTADVVDIVGYAASRGITVVPEIELPGHSSAAIAAYPELSCTGQNIEVPRTWGIFEQVYCASSEKAASILEAVLEETCRLFPGPWVHIGGDEVIRKAWEACPRCQEKIRSESLAGERGLEEVFIQRFIAYLGARGKTAVGWNEMVEHKVPLSAVAQWWLHPDLAKKSLEAGNPLLSSNTEYCYFDYPYTSENSWYDEKYMKVIPVSKVYENPVVPPGCEHLAGGILGGEACLWTEHLTAGQENTRLDGRLEALAEVYWSFDARPGFPSFLERARLLGLNGPNWQVQPPSQPGAGE